MNNQKQEKHHGANQVEPATASTSPPPQVLYHSDVCSICMDNVCMLDTTTFGLYSCCGKLIHTKCQNDLHGSNLSDETKNSCPWCRAENVKEEGSAEEIRRLRKWSTKKNDGLKRC